MNKIFLIGNAKADVELNSAKNDTFKYAKFDIAVSEYAKNKENKKEVTWFNIVAFGKLAEICSNFIKKGNKVCVVGKLALKNYQNKDGETKTSVEVIAENIEFLTTKPKENEIVMEPVDDLPF